MAIFQVATNTPSKAEIIGGWLPEQAWATEVDGPIELLGSFHLDDPEGVVGMQVFIVRAGSRRFQVPLTYRAERVPGWDGALVGEMQHSVLGLRHLYDGIEDERFLSVFAGVAVCGFGQALGFAQVNGRWEVWPDTVRLHGVGSVGESVVVDGFHRQPSDLHEVVVGNESIELVIHRELLDQPAPSIGLTGTWPGQADPVPLVQVAVHSGSS